MDRLTTVKRFTRPYVFAITSVRVYQLVRILLDLHTYLIGLRYVSYWTKIRFLLD